VLGAGGVLGIVLAGPILEHLSYHWLFWIPLVVAVGSTAAAYLVVPDRRAERTGGVSYRSAVLLGGWLICLLLGVSEGPAWGWSSGRVVGLFAGGVVLVLAWIAAEQRARTPLVDLRMLRGRGVWTTNVVAVLVGWGMYSGFVLLPEHAEAPASAGGFGASVATAGPYLVPWTFAVALASAVSGRLSALFGSRMPLIIGCAISTAGFVWLLDQHDHPVADHRRVLRPRRGHRLRLRVDGQPRHRECRHGADGGRDGGQHPHAHGRRRRRHPGRGDRPRRDARA
jgi:hypothetical protein